MLTGTPQFISRRNDNISNITITDNEGDTLEHSTYAKILGVILNQIKSFLEFIFLWY